MPVSILPNGVTVANDAIAQRVTFDNTMLHCHLQDGRVISVPIAWYPRLSRANLDQLNEWELIGGGIGIHWEQLDEDIAVSVLLAGCGEPENEVPTPMLGGHVFLTLSGHGQAVASWPADQRINYGDLDRLPLVADHP